MLELSRPVCAALSSNRLGHSYRRKLLREKYFHLPTRATQKFVEFLKTSKPYYTLIFRPHAQLYLLYSVYIASQVATSRTWYAFLL